MDLVISIDTADQEQLARKLYNLREASTQYQARFLALPPTARAQPLMRLAQALTALNAQIATGAHFDIVFRSDDTTGRLQRIFTCEVNAACRVAGDPLYKPYWDGMLADNLFP